MTPGEVQWAGSEQGRFIRDEITKVMDMNYIAVGESHRSLPRFTLSINEEVSLVSHGCHDLFF